MIDFSRLSVSRDDTDTILAIARRALPHSGPRLSLVMDLEVCHALACPLDLPALLAAPDSDFFHDVNGVVAHLDRETGALGSGFLPRYALRAEEV